MTSDSQRVEAWFRDGRLVRPGGGPSSVHVARAIASVVGAPTTIDEPVRAIAGRIGETDHLVFVLADGLGMNLLESLPDDSLLRRRCAMQINAVFPPSTAPALTSLATAHWPATHGVLFWYQYLRQPGITVAPLPFTDRFTYQPIGELGIRSEHLFSYPPQVTEFRREVLSLQPKRSSASEFTRYFTGGTPVFGYESLEQAIDVIAHRVTTSAGPTYTYFYYSAIDGQQHDFGPDSPEAMAALLRFEGEVVRLAEAVAGHGRVVMSADHGQFRVEEDAIRYIEEDDELLDTLMCVPTGEGSAPAFHVRPGRAQAFEADFRRRFGEEFALLSAAEVEAMGLFGPGRLSERARDVLGDYLALTADPIVLRYRPKAITMPGDHGGLSPAEMNVPLIVI